MATDLPVIYRTVAAVLVVSSDDHLLLGRKDPTKGGVYPGVWHLPGGGVEEGETLEDAAVREVFEEAGLRIEPHELHAVGPIGHGESRKKLKDGQDALCKMEFHRFEVRMPFTAEELKNRVTPGDDLVELKWCPLGQLGTVEQIPGAVEFYQEIGYIQ